MLDKGTTYAAFLCICWITCDLLLEQLHNYHKALGEPADVIELERCHGYLVLLGIAACLDSNIIYDDRNGGVMVDNEDVRAALVELKNETMIGEDNVADRDRDLVIPLEKYVFLQQPRLVKKTSSINCPPRFAVQLE